MAKRNSKALATITSRQRRDLDASLHATVDGFLRFLKPCHKRYQAAILTIQNEGQILERVFYKGKSQHRSALFWRRLSDIRKFCHRIPKLDPSQTILALSQSFFGGDAPLFKGSWDHCPDEGSLGRISSQLAIVEAFFHKMTSRSMEAHRHFSLVMQSGAFIQLLLTMIGMASRLHALAHEMITTVKDLRLHLKQFQAVISASPQSKPSTASGDSRLETEAERQTPADSPPSQTSLISIEPEIQPPALSAAPVARSRPKPLDSKSKIPLNTKPKKKKAKRDEIDDIFGV